MLPYLLDYFDGLYPQVLSHKPFFGKKFLQRVLLSLIYRINNFLCWYYHNVKKKNISSPEDSQYLVSLTTYPARMSNLWRVIEMIANQRDLKEKYAIILNLIESEFEGIELPKEIKELQERGLTVRFHKENLRCHNKYYYTFRDYPDKTVITVDDDLQYNHHTVTSLITVGKKHPDCIVYHRGNRIIPYTPYNDWPFVNDETTPQTDILPTGVGGVLYPPHCCHSLVTDMEVIKKTCLKADDLWLNFMSRLNNTKVVQTGLKSTFMLLPDTSQNTSLWSVNNDVVLVGNDVQIAKISEWSKPGLNCDYFVNI